MSLRRLSVGLLFGGVSPEHEVSIVSARSVASHLDQARFDIRPMGIARNGVWVVRDDPFARLSAGACPKRGGSPYMPLEAGAEDTPLPDVFFNIIHGAQGEDGQLQGLLESLDRPYTGAGLACMALTMDKWLTKRVWEAEGLPVVPYVGVTEEGYARDPQAVLSQCENLGKPLFIKPANLGSSIGIEKVRPGEALGPALERAFRFDRRVLVEQGIDARELELAVLGGDDPLVSCVGEVLVAGEFYDFADKYLDGKSRTTLPAEIPDEVATRAQMLAKAAFRSVDGYGMARVDFFLCRRTGQLYVNEINTIPGFTSISMFPKLMEAAGVPYAEQLTRLVDLALARHTSRRAKLRDFSSGNTWYKG